MKYTIGRERPKVSSQPRGRLRGPKGVFDRDDITADYDSFPSGHSCTAFGIATVLSDRYDAAWIPYVTYTTATCISISRIIQKDHWASDCFAGALLGYYGTKLVEHFNEAGWPCSILPTVGTAGYGVSICYQF